MWCSKCKSEYRDGITVCPQCKIPLVEAMPVEVDISATEDKIELLNRMDSQENMHALSDGSRAYVEKNIKYEDMKSTACSFLLVGIAGIVLLVLIYSGIIPLQFAPYMKYMMAIVMGGIFLIFLIIGIRSYTKLGDLKAEVLTEQQNTAAAKTWFNKHYSAKAVDAAVDIDGSEELQQKYFLRSSFIKRALQGQFPAYEDSFLDYLTEHLYEELYPED